MKFPPFSRRHTPGSIVSFPFNFISRQFHIQNINRTISKPMTLPTGKIPLPKTHPNPFATDNFKRQLKEMDQKSQWNVDAWQPWRPRDSPGPSHRGQSAMRMDRENLPLRGCGSGVSGFPPPRPGGCDPGPQLRRATDPISQPRFPRRKWPITRPSSRQMTLVAASGARSSSHSVAALSSLSLFLPLFLSPSFPPPSSFFLSFFRLQTGL